MVDIALPGQAALTQAKGLAALNRQDIKATAQKFEASFLSIMIGQMFEGVSTEAPFGGGQGEAMFRSFFNDAVAAQVSRAGGIGIAASVEREMLKLQGLTEGVPNGA